MYRYSQRLFTLFVAFILFFAVSGSASPSVNSDYYRIVLLGDPHLPVREREVPDIRRRDKIMQAKQQLLDDINGWSDVTCVVALGDVTAGFGNAEEYAYAGNYFKKLNKPVYVITGNHDYIYTDSLSLEGKYVLGDAASRAIKLERFKKTFHTPLYYSERLGDYLLVFLSADSLDSRRLTQMSEPELAWLRQELTENRARPTIIFFHAPLKGTVLTYNKFADTPNFIAQPEADVQQIIEDNPQVMLWVSGHDHISAKNPNFASPINGYNNKVLNVHNTDLDRETLWTNSLFLYGDKIIIRTFDHSSRQLILERTVDCLIPNN